MGALDRETELSRRIRACSEIHREWSTRRIAREIGCAQTTVSYHLSASARERQRMTKQLGKPPPRYCQRCDVRLSVKRKRMKFCYRCGVTARKEQSDRHHRARLAKTYGLLLDDYDAIYEYQRGKCAICQRATGATKRLSVDHDHRIGAVRDAVRGLLCSKCNGMLGHARDDPAVFERAAAYLRSPPAREVLK